MIKITKENIANADIDIFGEWIKTPTLMVQPNPFKHCIISNFFKDSFYEKIIQDYPECPDNMWHQYSNPLEVKFALDDFNQFSSNLKNVFFSLSHPSIINFFENLFDIRKMTYDKFCNGGGLHIYPTNGRLNIHLDYEKHPILQNMQRRLNIIIYINQFWKTEWNGDTQLWSKDLKECCVSSYPQRNTALVFETTEESWHGLPNKIKCPDNIFRKSIAYYYISELDSASLTNKSGADETGYRHKAVFTKLPSDPYDDRMKKLYDIRPIRRITKEDMNQIWPEWRPEI